MDTAILSASAGLIGSLIGGISTFGASWVTQHKLLDSQTRMHNARQRRELYSEFIVEATKRLAEAWNHQAEGPEVVTNLYSSVQRMRLVSSSRVVNCAEEVMRGVIAAYVEPNRTFDEFPIGHAVIPTSRGIPRVEFIHGHSVHWILSL